MADQNQFFYRRLHSLLGVIPIGVFVVQHLIVNHFVVYGEESFNKAANFMSSLPFVLVLETFVIYLPILFHAILGVYIMLNAKNNVKSYGYFRNWMFVFQRISGIITFLFIIVHVWQTRVQEALGNAVVDFNMMADILTVPFYLVFYIIGIISTTFHLANGLWSFCVSWGITQSPRSQQIVTYATVLVFLATSYMGVRAIIEFAITA